MKKLLLCSLILAIVACKQSTETVTTENSQEVTEPTNLDQLKREASRLRAGGSIKEVTLQDSTATVTYVKDYDEYKKINPQSSLTESDLKAYWDSGDAVEKAVVDGAVRLMKKLGFINTVTLSLPYEGKVYAVTVDKAGLEKLTGLSFEKLTTDWDKSFVDPYVYDAAGRQKFFNAFGKIE